MPRSAAAQSLRFGRLELRPQEQRVLVDGAVVPLGARAFDLLVALAEQPGCLLGKQALIERVWPDTVVQENNLAAQMSALRKALGNDIIATIPGRGYRFVAPPGAADTQEAPTAPAPAGAAPRLRTNLPGWMPVLLGRGGDLARCGELLDTQRLVSVVGAGGIGKSLLAMHLLDARRESYPQGVCWVELAAADAAGLPSVVAAALGVEVARGEPVAALAGALAPLSMLLALDNAEHLASEVAALVQVLLGAAPALHIVVTSQVPLHLRAERVHRVGPLSVPETPLSAAQALQHGAVALFVDRAQAVDSRFELTDTTSAAVIDICRALDGLPLAIELAAARAPLLGAVGLRDALHDRLRLLGSGPSRDAPTRQRTLGAALAWSYGLLSASEKRVFRGLAVVAGSASLAFIQRLLTDPQGGLDDWAVLDALDGLVGRSLVAVIPGDAAATPRYRLLESPRAMALETLHACGERTLLQERHAGAVAALCDAAYETYFGGRVGADAWHRSIEPDFDNAREALAHAREVGDVLTELTIAATLLRALRSSAHAERMALADASRQRLGSAAVPPRLQLRVWIELSCVWADTQKQQARQAALHAVELAQALDDGADAFLRYHALARASSAHAQTGDLAAARELLVRAQALEDPSWPAQRRLWAAEAAQWLARMGGDSAAALRRGRELVALDKARGSDASIALGNLVDAELAAGDARAAVRSGSELVAVLAGGRQEYSLAFARINLGAAWLALDDPAHARAALAAAWAVAPAFELAHPAACYLALLAALERRPEAAALLSGFAEAEYAARREAREHNESAALARAASLARSALGDETWQRLLREGAALRSADVAALALPHDGG
jgi:predicted ATPase/DNA-binding winged helix-turn-helix (wHTH) protein